MKMMKHATLTVAFGLVVGLLVTACNGGSSTASSGVSLAEFNALKAQVATLAATVAEQQTTIQSLQAAVTKNTSGLGKVRLIVPNNGTGSSALTYAASSSTTASAYTWTFCGYPSTADPADSSNMCVQTDSGYYLLLTQPCPSGSDCYISRWKAYVGFTGAGCTGTPYIQPGSGFTGNPAGVVFTLDPQIPQGIDVNAGDYTNPAYYWYVPAGEKGQLITIASEWVPGDGCNATPGQSYGFEVFQNDSSITHALSEPRVGPSTPVSP